MGQINDFDLELFAGMNNSGKQSEKQPETTHVASDSWNPQSITTDVRAQIAEVVGRIVQAGLDITIGYPAWLNLGFALSDELGEDGREIYHQLSQMNSGYNQAECDKQYTACLKSNGSGITIKTFFKMAQDAGIDLSQIARESGEFCAECVNAQQYANSNKIDNSLIINDGTVDAHGCANAQTTQNMTEGNVVIDFHKTFSDKIPEEDWPAYLKPVLDSMDDAESRDKMLLGTLVVNSGIIPHIYGLYGGKAIYPPLYLIFYGPSASRKGEISSCINVVKPLKDEIIGVYQKEHDAYEESHSLWESKGSKPADKAERGPEPKEPEYRTPIIPANSSATAAYLALNANDKWGIMFETEASTLTRSLLSDYGNYSDGLLAAFHHEPIKINRVREKIHFEIEHPRLAIGMTCTPGQLPKLFPTFEDGLGNRFLFYGLTMRLEWISPFKKIEKPLDEIYEDLGKESLDLYHEMKKLGDRKIQFMLTESQEAKFDEFFSSMLMEQFSVLGVGISSFVFRLGVSAFRFAMVLTILRRYSEWDKKKPFFDENDQAIVCLDKDIDITLTIMDTLVNHTGAIYAALGKDDEGLVDPKIAQLTTPERKLFLALPVIFTTSDMKKAAKKLQINTETARGYLRKYEHILQLAVRLKNGLYQKTGIKAN